MDGELAGRIRDKGCELLGHDLRSEGQGVDHVHRVRLGVPLAAGQTVRVGLPVDAAAAPANPKISVTAR